MKKLMLLTEECCLHHLQNSYHAEMDLFEGLFTTRNWLTRQ
ncbi:hypothetical protein [Metabacillus idriensis]|nr:hypothetical protein [Metabacillus idriensis]